MAGNPGARNRAFWSFSSALTGWAEGTAQVERLRMHRGWLSPAVVLVGLILGSASSGTTLATAASGKAAVTRTTPQSGLLTAAYYSGSYTHTYTGSPDGLRENPGTEHIEAHYTFSESVSLFTPGNPHGKNGLGSGSSENSRVTIKLSGGQSRTYSPDAHQQNCSATFRARGGTATNFGVQQPPVYIVVNGTEGIVQVSGEPPDLFPVIRIHVTSGDVNQCGSGVLGPWAGIATCNTPITQMTDPEWTASDRGFDKPPYGFLHAVAKIDPHSPTYTHHYHVKDTSPPNPGCHGTDSVTADSTLTVNNSRATGLPSPTPYEKGVATAEKNAAKFEAKVAAKKNAQDDLRQILPQLTYFCGATALGATGVTFAGAGPAGASIAIGGGAIFMAALPDCDPLAKAAKAYLDIINDPPLGHLGLLATVRHDAVKRSTTPCPTWKGRPASFCAAFRADLTALLDAASNLRNVITAVATTVGRESGAVKQHNTPAAKLQDRHLARMSPQASAALRAFLGASTHYAALLRSVGLIASMSKAQDAKAIRELIDRLARGGVGENTLRQLAGRELVPQAVDLLALLAGHYAPPSAAPTGKTGSSTSTTTATSKQATITSVTFSGGPRNPSVVIHGSNLGEPPTPNPSGHPSGLNGCPAVAGDNGYDYGTSLYLANSSQAWAGGRYRPELHEIDCLDLVVTKFTPTEVAFRFGGPFYASTYPKFALSPGLQVQVVVNGATYDTTVNYS